MKKNKKGAIYEAPQIWNPCFADLNPIFYPLIECSRFFSSEPSWPTCAMLNHYAVAKQIRNAADMPIEFVSQTEKSQDFIDQYEPRAFLRGQVQTREQNWHDFFNAMVWLTFPKTKAEINAQQYYALKKRLGNHNQRTPIENVLTLFDENGAVILCSDPELIQLLQEFQWQELFWHRREEVNAKMKFIIFGHSIYEKALNPYIGMTASSLIFEVSETNLHQEKNQLLAMIDEEAQRFLASGAFTSTKKFFPLPVLGIPGWYSENMSPQFYQNTHYFRLVRKPIHL